MTQLGTRLLTMKIGATDYTAEVSDCRITSEASDADFKTFADAAAGGGRLYKLKFTAVQDPATGTLWDKVWTASGTSVAVDIRPAGGATPSPTTPSFTGNAIVHEPDGDLLGGEADESTTSRFTIECEWNFLAKPLRVIA